MSQMVLIVIGCLMSGIGGIMLLLISQVLNSIKELKEEIKILQRLESRIAVLESKLDEH